MEQFVGYSLDLPSQPTRDSQDTDKLLDALLHQKSGIASSKLEVLASAMTVRISLFQTNLDKIDDQRDKTLEQLAKLDRHALYHLRDHREKTVFYQALNSLETERRTQSVECWRDLVMVIRDFLYVWEAHQQAQARAIFLENVGA